MPKYKVEYDCTISFMATMDQRRQLKALAYALGMTGEVSKAIRHILDNTLPNIVAGFNSKQREKYDQVLENLRITEDFSAQIIEEEHPE